MYKRIEMRTWHEVAGINGSTSENEKIPCTLLVRSGQLFESGAPVMHLPCEPLPLPINQPENIVTTNGLHSHEHDANAPTIHVDASSQAVSDERGKSSQSAMTVSHSHNVTQLVKNHG